MGGGSYVNVMHLILEHETLLKKEKESALALSLVFNDTGILIASIFSLVMDNTLFQMAKKITVEPTNPPLWLLKE